MHVYVIETCRPPLPLSSELCISKDAVHNYRDLSKKYNGKAVESYSYSGGVKTRLYGKPIH